MKKRIRESYEEATDDEVEVIGVKKEHFGKHVLLLKTIKIHGKVSNDWIVKTELKGIVPKKPDSYVYKDKESIIVFKRDDKLWKALENDVSNLDDPNGPKIKAWNGSSSAHNNTLTIIRRKKLLEVLAAPELQQQKPASPITPQEIMEAKSINFKITDFVIIKINDLLKERFTKIGTGITISRLEIYDSNELNLESLREIYKNHWVIVTDLNNSSFIFFPRF